MRLVLVAPWLDPEGSRGRDFFNFEIDPQITGRAEVHLLESSNDAADVKESVRMIRGALPELSYHRFDNGGHFCLADLGTTRFPELRAIALEGARGLNSRA